MNEKQSNRSPRPVRANQRLLTISQAEAESGIPATSIRDLIARGFLPTVRLGDSRRIWIRRVDLDTLIERSVERATA